MTVTRIRADTINKYIYVEASKFSMNSFLVNRSHPQIIKWIYDELLKLIPGVRFSHNFSNLSGSAIGGKFVVRSHYWTQFKWIKAPAPQ